MLSCILLWASCAQIVAPSGGAKDTTPPKVEKEYPNPKTTSFADSRIIIKFDEYIQLKDVDEQVIISPPLPEKPIFSVSGKSLIIEHLPTFKSNTTYTINFGNSIVDNHEGNILGNYSYIFSTGTSIDTLHIFGTIKNAFDLKTEKGLSVCLYPTDSFTDSTIFKQKPYYYTKTTELGTYNLPNLPESAYKLVTFKDENKNLKYDKGEIIAFYDNAINTKDTLPVKVLYTFKPNTYPIYKLVDTFSKEPGRFTFVVYKPLNVSIKPNLPGNYYTWYKRGKDQLDTITIFGNQWKTDSVAFTFQTPQFDSVVFVKTRKNSKIGKLEIQFKKDVELNDTFTLTLNHPVDTMYTDTSKFKLIEDTTLVKPSIFFTSNRESVKIYFPLKEKTKYILSLSDSSLKDIYGNYSKGEKQTLITKGLKDYSTLVLHVKHPGDNYQYILQLIDETETKIFKEFRISKTDDINLDYVLPAKYRIKFIRDSNSNGVWDNGDYLTHFQPERVFYFPETLTLRAYWDLEQTIDMGKLVD